MLRRQGEGRSCVVKHCMEVGSTVENWGALEAAGGPRRVVANEGCSVRDGSFCAGFSRDSRNLHIDDCFRFTALGIPLLCSGYSHRRRQFDPPPARNAPLPPPRASLRSVRIHQLDPLSSLKVRPPKLDDPNPLRRRRIRLEVHQPGPQQAATHAQKRQPTSSCSVDDSLDRRVPLLEVRPDQSASRPRFSQRQTLAEDFDERDERARDSAGTADTRGGREGVGGIVSAGRGDAAAEVLVRLWNEGRGVRAAEGRGRGRGGEAAAGETG